MDAIEEKDKERLDKYKKATAILDLSVQQISMDPSYHNPTRSIYELSPEERFESYYEFGWHDQD